MKMAQRAYAPNRESIRSPRSIEYEVIARITHRLKKAITDDNKVMLIESIYENRRLWNLLAADVASPENGLPTDLRARIFYLSEFVNVHSRKVLRNETTAVSLLEINAIILGGFSLENPSK
ncbi:MAG: flagellar biosynthesis regulator FlaF [Aliishimia sp.]